MNSSFSRRRFGVISRMSSAVRGVDRRVEREQLIAHRQLVAVLLDERAHVVALEWLRGNRGTARSASCTTRRSRCRCRPRSLRRTRSPSSRRGAARAAPGTAHAASRSTGTGRRRARRRGRSRSRRSRSQHQDRTSRRCTGRSNRIRPWTSRSPSRNAIWWACREFAQKEIGGACPGVGGGAVPDRPAPRDGCVGPARHADPRAVGRHRHVDRRLRRRDGADRPGRPVGGRRVAGARDDRLVAAVPLRQRRAASVGCDRWPRDARSARSA